MTIIRPNLIGIDSSVLAAWAADAFSSQVSVRSAARAALQALLDLNWIPVLCWHHFEELVCHADEQLVAERIAFLRSLSHVAWIGTAADSGQLGSIVDLLDAEVEALLSGPPEIESPCREDVRARLVGYGVPEGLETLGLWGEVRPFLQARQARSREIASVAHAEKLQALQTRVLDLSEMQAIDDPSAAEKFREYASALSLELGQRGDRRLQDPTQAADRFTAYVADALRNMRDSDASLLTAFLQEFDVPRDDVTETMTLGEFADVASRRKVLRIVCRTRNRDLDRIWSRLRHARIPSLWVQEEIRRARSAAPRAAGSDLVDSYLAAFAPYLDAVVVDKRTYEFLTQACRRSDAFAGQLGRLLRVAGYEDLLTNLRPGAT